MSVDLEAASQALNEALQPRHKQQAKGCGFKAGIEAVPAFLDQGAVYCLGDYKQTIETHPRLWGTVERSTARVLLYVLGVIAFILFIYSEVWVSSSFSHGALAGALYTDMVYDQIPTDQFRSVVDSSRWTCPCSSDGPIPITYPVLNCSRLEASRYTALQNDLCWLIANTINPLTVNYDGNMLFKEDFVRRLFKDITGSINFARSVVGYVNRTWTQVSPSGADASDQQLWIAVQCVLAEALITGGLGFNDSSFLVRNDFRDRTCVAHGLPFRSALDNARLLRNRSLWIEDGMTGEAWDLKSVYTMYLEYCAARMCFVTSPKTLHHRVVEFMAALGGLYSIGIFILVNCLWSIVQRTGAWQCGSARGISTTIPGGQKRGGVGPRAVPLTDAEHQCSRSLDQLSDNENILTHSASRRLACAQSSWTAPPAGIDLQRMHSTPIYGEHATPMAWGQGWRFSTHERTKHI